jgi:hypothetical protein
LSIDALRYALQASNVVSQAGALVADNQYVPVTAGTFLADRTDVAELVIGVIDGKAIHLSDVANVSAGPDQPEQYVRYGDAPAVTIAVAKKPGTNAAHVSQQVIERVASLEGIAIPDGVEYTVTRDYGKTADDKAKKADPEADIRDDLSDFPDLHYAWLARSHSGRFGRRRDAHTDTIRVLGMGFHHQPRVAVRADLLDWHPCR